MDPVSNIEADRRPLLDPPHSWHLTSRMNISWLKS
jgi:hypothetical protein